MAAKVERRNYDMEFLERLARIEENLSGVKNHLSKINGSIADYPVTKSKVDEACLKLVGITVDIEENIKKPLTKIAIKVYSAAILTGIFSGGIGILVGYFIAKLVMNSIGLQ